MTKFIRHFQSHAEYEAFTQTSAFKLPNVSDCINEGDVHYNPWEELKLTIWYNASSTTSVTKLMFSSSTELFSDMEVDGVMQENVATGYTFSEEGEHVVKYTIADPTLVGEKAFAKCAQITKAYIPNSVTTIGASAFTNCGYLVEVHTPKRLTFIGRSAFNFCGSLTEIAIPSTIEEIQAAAFDNCNNLHKVITPDIEPWLNLDFNGQMANPLAYGADLYSDKNTKWTNLIIPYGFTEIKEYAFRECYSFTSITIPDSVISIRDNAFCGCINVPNIVIPDSVTTIETAAFNSCRNLTSVTISSGVTQIGQNAFTSDRNLEEVIIRATTPPEIDRDIFGSTPSTMKIYVPAESVDAYKAVANLAPYVDRIVPMP